MFISAFGAVVVGWVSELPLALLTSTTAVLLFVGVIMSVMCAGSGSAFLSVEGETSESRVCFLTVVADEVSSFVAKYCRELNQGIRVCRRRFGNPLLRFLVMVTRISDTFVMRSILCETRGNRG